MENHDNKGQFSVDIKPDVAEGSYSNLVLIGHSPTEFTLDFASMLPGMGKPLVHNRIIMTPENVKKLLGALQENIRKYEEHFGAIKLEPKMTFPLGGFGNGAKS